MNGMLVAHGQARKRELRGGNSVTVIRMRLLEESVRYGRMRINAVTLIATSMTHHKESVNGGSCGGGLHRLQLTASWPRTNSGEAVDCKRHANEGSPPLCQSLISSLNDWQMVDHKPSVYRLKPVP